MGSPPLHNNTEVNGTGDYRPRATRVGTAILRAGVIVATFLMAVSFGQYNLATIFQVYDDEGYVLLSLDHYLAGGHLYTEVFSQYGPFYFYFQAALFRLLGLSVNHDAGRLVTLIAFAVADEAFWVCRPPHRGRPGSRVRGGRNA